MAELRDIFRAEDGSEWHAFRSRFSEWGYLWVTTGAGVGPIRVEHLKFKIEGPYRVWTEK